MFSGIGGFEKGIEDAGKDWECVGYSEIDRYASAIYKYHYPEHKNYGDCRTIDAVGLPDFDCIVGGFPCQSFSIAGKRGGFEDTRGTLFFEVARIARIKRPSYLFLENVKGLLSHDEGNTFATIITTLDELGYDCQWQVLDSRISELPQSRERIYIICNFRRERRPKIFPYKETNQINNQLDGETVQRGKKFWNGTLRARPPRNFGAGDCAIYTASGIRWKTEIEYERLQGFSDDWTKLGINTDGETINIPDSQRYKTCGNAVTTKVIRKIVEKWNL